MKMNINKFYFIEIYYHHIVASFSASLSPLVGSVSVVSAYVSLSPLVASVSVVSAYGSLAPLSSSSPSNHVIGLGIL